MTQMLDCTRGRERGNHLHRQLLTASSCHLGPPVVDDVPLADCHSPNPRPLQGSRAPGLPSCHVLIIPRGPVPTLPGYASHTDLACRKTPSVPSRVTPEQDVTPAPVLVSEKQVTRHQPLDREPASWRRIMMRAAGLLDCHFKPVNNPPFSCGASVRFRRESVGCMEGHTWCRYSPIQ